MSRLLCNHRLELDAWSASRHWPAVAPRRAENEADALAALSSAVRNNLRVILDNFRAALALTGGGDSRTLLSLVQDRRAELVTYIVQVGSPNSELDVHLSNMIAKRFGLDHRVLSPPPPDPEFERQWHFRCGHVRGGMNSHIYTALHRLGDREAIIDGLGAEVGRCFFWKQSDTAVTPLNAEAITRRFGMPLRSEFVEATDRWLAEVPKGDAFYTLDLAYHELRSCAWAYADSYVDPTLLHFSPFSSRQAVMAMYELPISAKRGQGFTRPIIELNWPELSTVPYNKYGDARDWLRVAKRALRIYSVRKKLRKIFAP